VRRAWDSRERGDIEEQRGCPLAGASLPVSLVQQLVEIRSHRGVSALPQSNDGVWVR